MRKLLYFLSVSMLVLTACSNDLEENENAEQTAESEDTTKNNQTKAEVLYHIDQTTFQVIPNDEDTNAQVALLTFDDSPDQYAVDIAHTLKELDAPAIFFVNGMFLESEEGKAHLKEIYDLGFEIGNHTQNHPNLDTLNYEETEYEITETNRLVEEITGEKPRFFRAPFGVNTEYSIQVVEDEGMEYMNWTYGYDFMPEYQDKGSLEDITVNTEFLNYGANILMHDREWTRDAIANIVKGLREKDYMIVDPHTIGLQ